MKLSKIISLVIAVAYLVIVHFIGDQESLFEVVPYLIFVITLIWYGDDLAYYGVGSGIGGHDAGRIDEPSPPSLIKFMGWVLLLIPILLIPLAILITAK